MDFKVLHHHRTGNEANILSEQLTNGFSAFNFSRRYQSIPSTELCAVSLPSVHGSRQPPFLPLNGDASSSARIKSAAGDARAKKGLVLIKGVGGWGVGVCVGGGGWFDALDEFSPSEVAGWIWAEVKNGSEGYRLRQVSPALPHSCTNAVM